jgi:hypothetical protein
MISGDRFSHRSSMSIALNRAMAGLSFGVIRRACSAMDSSVAYTRRPWTAANRRAMDDLPDPLPPPIQ